MNEHCLIGKTMEITVFPITNCRMMNKRTVLPKIRINTGREQWFGFLLRFTFGCTGVWTQGLLLIRQALYHLSHSIRYFYFSYFSFCSWLLFFFIFELAYINNVKDFVVIIHTCVQCILNEFIPPLYSHYSLGFIPCQPGLWYASLCFPHSWNGRHAAHMARCPTYWLR
jgi:hypothetical protein